MLALAACGSTKSPAERIAACLNARSFLVQASGSRVEGSSPGGINFTLSVSGLVNDAGNPGGRRLSRNDRRSIAACLH